MPADRLRGVAYYGGIDGFEGGQRGSSRVSWEHSLVYPDPHAAIGMRAVSQGLNTSLTWTPEMQTRFHHSGTTRHLLLFGTLSVLQCVTIT
jgi:hypothetical protein